MGEYRSEIKTARDIALERADNFKKYKGIDKSVDNGNEDSDYSIYPKPLKDGCKCNGTGRLGWTYPGGVVIVCNCITGRIGKVEDNLFKWEEWNRFINQSPPVDGRKIPHTRPKSVRRVESKLRKKFKKNRWKHNEMVN